MAMLFKTPKMPAVAKATPMPDDKQLNSARRRRIAKETGRGGAESTVLSNGKETLGA